MLRSLILGAGLGLLALEAASRPNIVFILADDLGYSELGCYGQRKIRTPRIDSLAAEGMRFTANYAGNAVCAPSRCVLMTGKHRGHAVVRNNSEVRPEGQRPIPDGESTLAEQETQIKLLKAELADYKNRDESRDERSIAS